ncbi:cytochrome b [Aquitalea sp. USM4]|uniref:cytochrome b n=1 Tax=Aquitalea sp. USM4 TaxID=1590041 RepID=UPI001A95482A|nr:cytochrome b [Aquitalea sp. USM4]
MEMSGELSASSGHAGQSARRYPLLIILAHWLIAGGIAANLVTGWLLDDATELLDLHRSIGVLVLAFSALRLFCRFAYRKQMPDSVNEAGSLQYRVEKLAHTLLYAGMVLVPLLGWLKTNAAGHVLVLFDTVELPVLMAKNRELSSLFGELHSVSAYLLAMLIGLHIAGGVAHVMMEKRNVFKRMLPF